MMQRYIVFLNERAVIITQNINIPDDMHNDIVIDYTTTSSIQKAFLGFHRQSAKKNLIIKTSDNFEEACKQFNSLFRPVLAAGGIVRNQKNEYLFIKRFGIWDLPKGKLHKGESAQEGALREVTEETGLNGLTITKQLPSTFHIYTDKKGAEVLKETFWFEMMCFEEQPFIPQLEEDITEVKWFSSNKLSIPLYGTYASLRRLLESYIHE